MEGVTCAGRYPAFPRHMCSSQTAKGIVQADAKRMCRLPAHVGCLWMSCYSSTQVNCWCMSDSVVAETARGCGSCVVQSYAWPLIFGSG